MRPQSWGGEDLILTELSVCRGVWHLNLAPVQVSAVTVLGSEANLCSVSQAVIPEQCQGASFPLEGELLCRLPKLMKRMRKVCLTLMKESRLPYLVEGLDHFTGECQQPGAKCGVCSVFSSAPKSVGICCLGPFFDVISSVERLIE